MSNVTPAIALRKLPDFPSSHAHSSNVLAQIDEVAVPFNVAPDSVSGAIAYAHFSLVKGPPVEPFTARQRQEILQLQFFLWAET
ncbi:hypothetical protein SAMN05518866_12048 [Sphingobium sp. YR768]|nr:hypothetical protein SAMN05518866_12048 [Sphingobium sp. YR768]